MAEKIININDREVKFVVNGLTPVTYMSQHGNDFMEDFLKLEKGLTGQGKLDTMALYNIVFICAKNADKNIDTLEDWLESFEDGFPVFDVIGDLMPLLQKNFTSNKKDKLARKK